jgi:porin
MSRFVPAAFLAPLLALAALPAQAQTAAPACEEGRALTPGLCASLGLTADGVGVASGGVRRGVSAVAQVRLGLTADFGTLAGLDGWRGSVSAMGIWGRQPTLDRVGSLAPASNIEALTTFRLFELWLERDLAGHGSLRFGQLAADSEFATAEAAGNLVNGTFGWPVALAGALPSGGPAYPLATPGARLALGDPDGATGFRIGVFSGDPGGRYGDGDPQRHNRHGLNFSTRGGAFVLAEGVTGAEAVDGARPWALKLGGWYHTARFDDQRRDDTGLSLADPGSSGQPLRRAGNYGGYAVAEAVVWRGEGQRVAVFARGFLQPADRNAVSLQLDAGLAWSGPLGREADTLSLGISHARIGARGRGLDRDLVAFGAERPVRSHETVLEVNYDLSVIEDRFSMRPFVQALFNPAAGEPDARRSETRAVPDAVLLGLRLTAAF